MVGKYNTKQNITAFGVCIKSANDIPNKRMKPMELDFVHLESKMMTKPASPTKATTVVEETTPTIKKRKKFRKFWREKMQRRRTGWSRNLISLKRWLQKRIW